MCQTNAWICAHATLSYFTCATTDPCCFLSARRVLCAWRDAAVAATAACLCLSRSRLITSNLRIVTFCFSLAFVETSRCPLIFLLATATTFCSCRCNAALRSRTSFRTVTRCTGIRDNLLGSFVTINLANFVGEPSYTDITASGVEYLVGTGDWVVNTDVVTWDWEVTTSPVGAVVRWSCMIFLFCDREFLAYGSGGRCGINSSTMLTIQCLFSHRQIGQHWWPDVANHSNTHGLQNSCLHVLSDTALTSGYLQMGQSPSDAARWTSDSASLPRSLTPYFESVSVSTQFSTFALMITCFLACRVKARFLLIRSCKYAWRDWSTWRLSFIRPDRRRLRGGWSGVDDDDDGVMRGLACGPRGLFGLNSMNKKKLVCWFVSCCWNQHTCKPCFKIKAFSDFLFLSLRLEIFLFAPYWMECKILWNMLLKVLDFNSL